ncbi:hypothetical protein DL93DRAFT_2079018 [Clavulina sp. PMI_390]|nr:hypothetical protein DL93DRAFT_2079018 [Clavulina sp. PMI_390]
MRFSTVFAFAVLSFGGAANAIYCCHYVTGVCPSPVSPLVKRTLVNPEPEGTQTCCTCYASSSTTCPTPSNVCW